MWGDLMENITWFFTSGDKQYGAHPDDVRAARAYVRRRYSDLAPHKQDRAVLSHIIDMDLDYRTRLAPTR